MEATTGRRRSVVNDKPTGNVVVAAGSVWESRMKLDEVKGGFKVFNADDDDNPQPPSAARRSVRSTGTVASSGKRKTWKSESFDGGPIQLGRVTASVDGGVKRSSPIQGRKLRSEAAAARSPVQASKKGRSEIGGGSSSIGKLRSGGDSGKEVAISPAKLESEVGGGGGVEKGGGEMEAVESEHGGGIEKKAAETEENCREFGVCEEKVISSAGDEDNHGDGDGDEEDEEEGGSEEGEEETEEEIEKKSVDVKEINVQEDDKPKRAEIAVPELKPARKVVHHHQFQNRAPPPAPPAVKKQPPPVIRRATAYQNFTKPTTTTTPSPAQSRNRPGRQSKLQNLVDLVMWRDASRSAFVFGSGTFVIISSSYSQDLNISFISVMAYLGLVYLAAIFVYRTLVSRGIVEGEDSNGDDDQSYVVGEGEAICVVKLVLPYLNECLLRIKALFSGDPSTTMKLAVLLFVLARCGGYITIWKMTKLGFFGVFILPKVCSSYSSQLTSCAKFWIRRFRDAWEKCAHKKAVALGVFTLVWNMSSIVARIWAVFMMFVAVRYYQQRVAEDGENWEECDDEEDVDTTPDATREEGIGPRRLPNYFEVNSKVKRNY